MDKKSRDLVENAKHAATQVLLHNSHGPYRGLPRTAGWGYPEPYTRDLMISSLGILLSDHQKLIKALRKTLETVARNQSRLGHIPSLVHDSDDRGSSDCTPLFLLGAALYRKVSGEEDFLGTGGPQTIGDSLAGVGDDVARLPRRIVHRAGVEVVVGEEGNHRLVDFRGDSRRGVVVGVDEVHTSHRAAQTAITRIRWSTMSLRVFSTMVVNVWAAPAHPEQAPTRRQ